MPKSSKSKATEDDEAVAACEAVAHAGDAEQRVRGRARESRQHYCAGHGLLYFAIWMCRAKPRAPSAFARFVQDHFSALKQERPSASHKELMGELGKRFRESKEAADRALMQSLRAAEATRGDATGGGKATTPARPLQCIEIDGEDEGTGEAEAAIAALRLA